MQKWLFLLLAFPWVIPAQEQQFLHNVTASGAKGDRQRLLIMPSRAATAMGQNFARSKIRSRTKPKQKHPSHLR